jgi:hypothetical protein
LLPFAPSSLARPLEHEKSKSVITSHLALSTFLFVPAGAGCFWIEASERDGPGRQYLAEKQKSG